MIKTQDKFAVAPITLLESNQATNIETGEVIQITPEMKCVYFYMREKYCLSLKYKNKYTESWERIAATVAPMADQKLKKLSKSLRDIGLVVTLSKKDSVKQVVDVCDVEGWVFSNSELDSQLSPQAKAKRTSDKQRRMETWKQNRQAAGTWKDFSKEENKPTEPTKVEPTKYVPPAPYEIPDDVNPFDDYDFNRHNEGKDEDWLPF